jgi:hypothetical protein
MHLNNSNIANNSTSHSFSKKIGRANYRVLVYSSPSSREDFSDKLLRVIKNDTAEKAVTTL